MSRLPALSGRPGGRAPALALVLALGILALWPSHSAIARDEASPPTKAWTGRWSESVVDLFATVPVQAGGRVKPLLTWSRFALLALNERKSAENAAEDSIAPIEWWLDVSLRPDVAKNHKCFVITDSGVLDAMGASKHLEKSDRKYKKRDRFTYAELAPARARLSVLGSQYGRIDPKSRTRVQAGIVELNNGVDLYEHLAHLFDFARERFEIEDAVKTHFEGRGSASFSEVLEKTPVLMPIARAGATASNRGEEPTPESLAVGRLFMRAFGSTDGALQLRLLPPATGVHKETMWYSVRDVADLAIRGAHTQIKHLAALRSLEAMAAAVGDGPTFERHLREYHEQVKSLAEARGEYEKIEQEVLFYDLDPFGRAFILYIIIFALLAISWLRPGVPWLQRVIWIALLATLGLHLAGIVMRMVIRERAPMSTLYETVLFISAFAVGSCLIIERISRIGVALALAPLLGFAGLLVADIRETLDGQDTMPKLEAVLDTNFWLWFHVTCIGIGYAATLLCGFIAHVYVLGKAFGLKKADPAFYPSLARMVYGALCFGLLFSLCGTILGGIWANDSWGRFWGWDPKENGALMIVLANLAILHARMGGIIKTYGMCMGAIFGNCIVAFSWWGVNLLGIGLHTYGFASSIFFGLMVFYGIEGAVLLTGWSARLARRI